MSGFAFHLACKSCGLTSHTYPFRYDAVIPTEVQLPTTDRRDQRFGRFASPVTTQLSDSELESLAAAHSSAEVTIGVPAFHDDGVVVRPELACPRCGERTVVATFGRARHT